MQTPYETLSYQTPTSRNCKPFRTQLRALLLAAHKTQILKTHITKPRSYQWTPISNFMLRNLNNSLKHTLYIISMHTQIHPETKSHNLS